MVVDKKVELELQLISDLPEWNFLPENELQRKAILLFSNQRSAKEYVLEVKELLRFQTQVFLKFQSHI